MKECINSFSQRFTTAHALALFTLICMPMLFAPFIADDFFHLLMLSGQSPLPKVDDASLWGLFSFIQKDEAYRQALQLNGVLPWWASDQFYFTFWRPLSEITHWLDYRIAPHNSFFAHTHSLLWFIAFAILFKKLMQLLKLPHTVIFLAFLIFLFDGHHAVAIEWIANRNAILAGFFIFLALYCHIKARQEEKPLFYFVAIVCLFLALFSGEAALAGGGFFFAYAMFLDKEGKIKGFLSILPYLFIVLLWMLVHHKLGFGADGSLLLYTDPIKQPVEFIQVLSMRLPMNIFFLLGTLPAESFPFMTFIGPNATFIYLCIALLFLAFLFFFVFNLIKDQLVILFFLVGAVIAIIPFCSLITQDRLLLIPSLGFSVFIAFIIERVLAHGITVKSLYKQRILQAIAYSLLVIHLVLSPIYLAIGGVLISKDGKTTQNLILNAENIEQDSTVIIFQGALLNSALFKVVRTFADKTVPAQVLLLSDFSKNITLERVAKNQLILSRSEGFVYRYEESFRNLQQEPFNIGDEISIGNVTLQVLAINDKHQPTKLRLELHAPVEKYHFLSEKNGQLQSTALPGIGQSLYLK